jgi:hypothetical protein
VALKEVWEAAGLVGIPSAKYGKAGYWSVTEAKTVRVSIPCFRVDSPRQALASLLVGLVGLALLQERRFKKAAREMDLLLAVTDNPSSPLLVKDLLAVLRGGGVFSANQQQNILRAAGTIATAVERSYKEPWEARDYKLFQKKMEEALAELGTKLPWVADLQKMMYSSAGGKGKRNSGFTRLDMMHPGGAAGGGTPADVHGDAESAGESSDSEPDYMK